MRNLVVIMFIVFALAIVGCGKGSAGFDKPEDLGKKLIEVQTAAQDDLGAILEFVHFAKAEDKVKVVAYFDALQDFGKKMEEYTPKTDMKFEVPSFKEAKVEGDKGELLFSAGMPMKIVKVNGKWFVSEAAEMFQSAVKANLEDTKKQWNVTLENMKKLHDAKKNEKK